MAAQPLAQIGNFLHVYDFRVRTGSGDEFIRAFEAFDHSGKNPMHQSPSQVTDGVLCRDDGDPDHFYLIAEWSDKGAHRALLAQIKAGPRPAFLDLIEGDDFVPIYADVVA